MDMDTGNNQGDGGGGGEAPESINLKVVDQDGGETRFRVKFSTKMGKVMKNYAERNGQQLGSLRFLYDGRRIEEEDTPRNLGMENDEMIEVFSAQQGG